jgi:carboxypeptidase family protein
MVLIQRIVALAILITGLSGFPIVAFSPPPQAGSSASPVGAVITGMVKSAAGKKLEGVVVSAQADGSSITTSVFTDEEGLYFFPRLEKRHYRIWAQAVGFQTGNAEATIGASERVRRDLSLEILQDFSMQLTGCPPQ